MRDSVCGHWSWTESSTPGTTKIELRRGSSQVSPGRVGAAQTGGHTATWLGAGLAKRLLPA